MSASPEAMAAPEATKASADAVDTPQIAAEDYVYAIGRRNAFDRAQFARAWKLLYLIAGCLVASLALNFFLLTTKETPLPFAVTPDGRVFEITPLNEPVMNPEGVANWAARELPRLYNMDFRRYREQIAANEEIFTEAGYNGYMEALKRFGLVDDIIANNFLVTAVTPEVPTVVETGMLDGKYFWKVSAPLNVVMDSGNRQVNWNLRITAFVMRVPETDNPLGLSIHAFSAARR